MRFLKITHIIGVRASDIKPTDSSQIQEQKRTKNLIKEILVHFNYNVCITFEINVYDKFRMKMCLLGDISVAYKTDNFI